MVNAVKCSCGHVLIGKDDEELYGMVRQHVDPLHPEAHRPVPERPAGEPPAAERRVSARPVSAA